MSSSAAATKKKASFPAFFLMWAEIQNWEVPAFHLLVCQWLESFGRLGLLMMPRGHAKSTILAVYNAWRYYIDPTYRILHQGDQDDTAYKMSRDTQAVLARHPLCAGCRKAAGETQMWWVAGATDLRNASMQARGITSNVTSSRADEVQNDDVEVPRNIATPEARQKLRYRLGEQTHILVPGGRTLYIGTPHTHETLYDDIKALGADCLILKAFAQEHRISEEAGEKGREFMIDFRPEFVFRGISKAAKLLREGQDYSVHQVGSQYRVEFMEPVRMVTDLYAGALWPERFTADEMEDRRRKCRTFNEWDSQYQLHAKPVTDVRLNPERLLAYNVEPEIRQANDELGMFLGTVRIVSANLRWDPSSGKPNSDVSALCLVLQDAFGNLYWHRAIPLLGELAEFNGDGATARITGGQVMQVCDVIERFQLARVVVEVNGIGGHVPAILRGALKQRRLRCGVTEDDARGNKNQEILGVFEPALSAQYLWVHESVLDTVETQMREWNPGIKDQPDDYLDCAARAILAEPVRIGKQVAGKPAPERPEHWAQGAGEFEVEFSR